MVGEQSCSIIISHLQINTLWSQSDPASASSLSLYLTSSLSSYLVTEFILFSTYRTMTLIEMQLLVFDSTDTAS